MGDAKHTPGPWIAEDCIGAGWKIKGVIPFEAECVEYRMKAAEQMIFEMVAYERWVQFEPQNWKDMQAANARLIAAAPDLLEAVEKLLTWFPLLTGEGMAFDSKVARQQLDGIGLDISYARKALAKATT